MVYGTEGAAHFGLRGEVDVYNLKGKPVKRFDTTGKPAAPITNTDDRSGGGWSDTTQAHMANFVDCIRAKTPEKANANADKGVKSTFLALTANVSQFLGGPIDVDPSSGALLTKDAAKFWSREYAKGWELI